MSELMLEKAMNFSDLVEVKGNDKAFLTTKTRPEFEKINHSGHISLVDLFCGAGGITLGILEAAASLGKKVNVELAVDIDEKALNVYIDNFPAANAIHSDVLSIFESDISSPLNTHEKKLQKTISNLDFLVGGPPCQGHSDLNNFSRRKDHKNALYFVMARAAKIFRPNFVIIENVPGAKHDKNNVFLNTANELKDIGYNVSFETINLFDIGVPQKRKRLILIASKANLVNINEIIELYKTQPKSVHWAIQDLMQLDSQDTLMDMP
ncbi:DNA cytosine methyltransferase, partial [Salmonella enterica]|nr:DNA cytosine methyltransferase [Salmonella enterica]